MRWYNCLAIAALLLGGAAASPAYGEQIKYYVWTDEDGVVHAEDKPPKDRDYETRVIEINENVVPAPEPSGDGGVASPGSETGRRSTTTDAEPPVKTDAAIAEEEQRRLDQGSGPESGGADTAPGADTATSGANAPASNPAAAGSSAPGAATAPGASVLPPPPPPVLGP